MNRSRISEHQIDEATLSWQRNSVAGERCASPTIPARLRIFQALRNEWRALGSACGAFESIAMCYLAVSSILISIFAENLAHPVRLLATRACVVALIILVCRGTDILA